MSRLHTLHRNATFVWSPAGCLNRISHSSTGSQLENATKNAKGLLALATSAQHYDETFSTSGVVELYAIAAGAVEPSRICKVDVKNRYHCVAWAGATDSCGLLVAGSDNGLLTILDCQAMLTDPSTSVSSEQRVHSGSILSVSTANHRPELCASGAGHGQVFVWDLNQPEQPMAPGPVQEPAEQTVCVSWNLQVAHILSSLTASRAFLWDLRRGDGPIMTLADPGSGYSSANVAYRKLAWSPKDATSIPSFTLRLCVASDSDEAPIVLAWDVRYAAAPIGNLHGHQKGISSMDWCPWDPDLLVTCGRDSKIYTWDPNTATLLAEIHSYGKSWPHEVSWCSTVPDWLAVGTFDARVSLYTIADGGAPGQGGTSPLPSPKSPHANLNDWPLDHSGRQRTQSVQSMSDGQQQVKFELPTPPAWRRPGPVCCRFGFGGRIFTIANNGLDLDNAEQDDNQQQTDNNGTQPSSDQSTPRVVTVTQICTNPQLVTAASQLAEALGSDTVAEYCQQRARVAVYGDGEQLGHDEALLWTFLAARAKGASRKLFASALGLDSSSAQSQLESTLGPPANWKLGPEVVGDDYGSTQNEGTPTEENKNYSSNEGDISEEESELAASKSTLARSGGVEARYAEELSIIRQPLSLPTTTENQSSGLLCAAVSCGSVAGAVELCIRQNRWTDALMLALSGSEHLFTRVQRLHCEHLGLQSTTENDPEMSAACASSRYVALLCAGRWNDLVQAVRPADWKMVLGALLSFAPSSELGTCCDQLYDRMMVPSAEFGTNGNVMSNAALPAILAAKPDKLAAAMLGSRGESGGVMERLVGFGELFVQGTVMSEFVGRVSVQNALSACTALRWSITGGSPRIAPANEKIHQLVQSVALGLANQGAVRQAKVLLDTLDVDPEGDLDDMFAYRELHERVAVHLGDRSTNVKVPYKVLRVAAQPAPAPRQRPALQHNVQRAPPAPTSAQHPMLSGRTSYSNAPGSTRMPAGPANMQRLPQAPPGASPRPLQAIQPPQPPPASAINQYQYHQAAPQPSPAYQPNATGMQPTQMPAPGAYGMGSYGARQVAPPPPPMAYRGGSIRGPGMRQSGAPLAGASASQQQYMPTAMPASYLQPQLSYAAQPPPPPPPPTQTSHGHSQQPPVAAVAPVPYTNANASASADNFQQSQISREGSESRGWNDPPLVPVYANGGGPGTGAPPIVQAVQQSASGQGVSSAQNSASTVGQMTLPPEVENMRALLDEFIQACDNASTVQPMLHKRVLDARTKLHAHMWPVLASGKQKASTINTLSQLCTLAHSGDSHSALQLFTSLLQSGVDFADLSHFAPALKVILQVGRQLGVRVNG